MDKRVELLKKNQQLIGWKKGTIDQRAKASLANFYYNDFYSYFLRVRILQDALISDNTLFTRSFTIKLAVDMVLGVECGLKALISSLSIKREKIEELYSIIRQGSHKIKSLLTEFKIRSKRRIKNNLNSTDENLLSLLNDLGVEARYSIEFDQITKKSQKTYKERYERETGKKVGYYWDMLESETPIKVFMLQETHNQIIEIFKKIDALYVNSYNRFMKKFINGGTAKYLLQGEKRMRKTIADFRASNKKKKKP